MLRRRSCSLGHGELVAVLTHIKTMPASRQGSSSVAQGGIAQLTGRLETRRFSKRRIQTVSLRLVLEC
jgi:hypothetical protein